LDKDKQIKETGGEFKAKVQRGYRIVIPEAERIISRVKEGSILAVTYKVLAEGKVDAD